MTPNVAAERYRTAMAKQLDEAIKTTGESERRLDVSIVSPGAGLVIGAANSASLISLEWELPPESSHYGTLRGTRIVVVSLDCPSIEPHIDGKAS